MIDRESLGIIRFVDVPRGGAPLEIRQKWIGIEVPCLYYEEGNASSREIGTGRVVPPHPVYVVLQTHAIEALARVSPEAARYWEHIGYPQHELALFTFSAESAVVIKPVMSVNEFYGML